jgi:hypothetical protein
MPWTEPQTGAEKSFPYIMTDVRFAMQVTAGASFRGDRDPAP